MKKNNKIQILRALSIFAVILIHTCPNGIKQVIFRPFLNFSVAMFIFLSGYLTKIENDNWLIFYKKRIIRVIIPYVLWSIIYTIYGGGGVKTIITNLITTQSAAQLYYIFVYIQFVILTPLLGKLIKSKYRYIGWIISPISVIIFKYYYLLSGNMPNRYISIVWNICCLGWFTYYYLGLLLGNKVKKINTSEKKLIIFCSISIILQMFEGYIWLKLGEINCGTQLKLTSFLTSTLCILIAYKFINNDSINLKSKLLVLIGDCSFGIYLSHILVMNLLRNIPYYSKIPFIINSVIILVISLILILISKKLLGKKISKYLGLI